MTKEDFLKDLTYININFSTYETSKYTFIAMLGLRTVSDEDQKQAILSVLNYNSNIEVYINDHLETEQTFFVVNK